MHPCNPRDGLAKFVSSYILFGIAGHRKRSSMRRYPFKHKVDGVFVEHTLIITTVAEWRTMPESGSSAWALTYDGDDLLALAPILPGVEMTGTPLDAVGLPGHVLGE